jgi:ABC-2 type transport system ATP-binding protein/ribosome-dependent ATPase
VRAAAQAGVGVLITTHHMDEADECDRLVIMAAGRVVAEGTGREICGDATVVVVQSDKWSHAFGALERAGLPVDLAGLTLRVPGADIPAVKRVLGDIPARVAEAPATLEERFFEIVSSSNHDGETRDSASHSGLT